MLKHTIWCFALAACALPAKSHCKTSGDCLGTEVCTMAGSCETAPANIVGDWFGGLPDDTQLDNDGIHYDPSAVWDHIKAIEPTTGPDANSRLDPDENYCIHQGAEFGFFELKDGQIIGGSPDDGAVVLLTAHEMDIVISGSTKRFFRIDPPRMVDCPN